MFARTNLKCRLWSNSLRECNIFSRRLRGIEARHALYDHEQVVLRPRHCTWHLTAVECVSKYGRYCYSSYLTNCGKAVNKPRCWRRLEVNNLVISQSKWHRFRTADCCVTRVNSRRVSSELEGLTHVAAFSLKMIRSYSCNITCNIVTVFQPMVDTEHKHIHLTIATH